jgi:hypothetical protein
MQRPGQRRLADSVKSPATPFEDRKIADVMPFSIADLVRDRPNGCGQADAHAAVGKGNHRHP